MDGVLGTATALDGHGHTLEVIDGTNYIEIIVYLSVCK
jgi:hypothetical protein